MIGLGSTDGHVSRAQILDLCGEFFEQEALMGRRILCVIPDSTRSGPIDLLFHALCEVCVGRAKALDFLIALGTHPPMSEEAIDLRLGCAPGERLAKYPGVSVFNHHWNSAKELRAIGELPASRVADLSQGMMSEAVLVRINRHVFDYDIVLIVGPTFPHEVVGFSGGNKYLFPGISGPEIIDMFHWLGALITNPVIIGTRKTPVRAVIDAAAELLPVRRLCISLVVKGKTLAGMYCGAPETAWSAAADLSERLHIVRADRPYHRVLSCAPAMYDDLWVGGKAAYKLEPVVAEGGELIIYAPHIREISVTHGELVEKIGYHVRDYFVSQMDRFRDIPRGVLAHSTHVKGIGTFRNGVEKARMNVVLATGIPEDVCRRINLGYRDPATIDPEEWKGREAAGILHVPHAGEILYRLRDDPFRQAVT